MFSLHPDYKLKNGEEVNLVTSVFENTIFTVKGIPLPLSGELNLSLHDQ